MAFEYQVKLDSPHTGDASRQILTYLNQFYKTIRSHIRGTAWQIERVVEG